MTKTMIKHEKEFIHVPKSLFVVFVILAMCAGIIYVIWAVDWALIISQFDEKKTGVSLDTVSKVILSLGILAVAEAIFIPKSREGLIVGLIAGLTAGLILGLIVGLIAGLTAGLIVGLTAGLTAGLIGGLNDD